MLRNYLLGVNLPNAHSSKIPNDFFIQKLVNKA